MRLAGRVVTVIALCLAIGLHWAALQSIAWTKMFVANATQSSSLAQAVAKTFDGSHPCDLCKGINAAQHSQKKQQAQPAPSKPDLICTARPIRIISSFQDFHYPENAVPISERGQSPPVPPPRTVLA
jgi:hypothetical protein